MRLAAVSWERVGCNLGRTKGCIWSHHECVPKSTAWNLRNFFEVVLAILSMSRRTAKSMNWKSTSSFLTSAAGDIDSIMFDVDVSDIYFRLIEVEARLHRRRHPTVSTGVQRDPSGMAFSCSCGTKKRHRREYTPVVPMQKVDYRNNSLCRRSGCETFSCRQFRLFPRKGPGDPSIELVETPGPRGCERFCR